MAKVKSSYNRIYSKFPFNQCLDEHLFDTVNLIKHGVNLTIQIGTLNLEEIERYENKQNGNNVLPNKEELLDDLLEEREDDADDEEEEEDYHLPPSPILIPIELPKSSMKRRYSSTFSTNSSEANICVSSSPKSQPNMTLLICRNKLQHLIDEFFECISCHDHKIYQEISNYVINSIVQNEPNLEIFVNKIIDYKFKNELIEIIKTLFVEKFEETKLEELIDYMNNLINLKENCIKNLDNPMIYTKYYKIWRLCLSNYRFYEEEYFFDYFNNSYSNLESVLLQNAFLINYKKFVHYFSKDIVTYDEDDDDEDDEEEDGCDEELDEIDQEEPESPLLHYQVTSNTTPELLLDSSLNETPKLLRFNDDINVININRYLPVDHVLYNQFIKHIE